MVRFWRLDSYPALNADEAAIGYNAYSLIETNMDEHGNPWPIHFQSFNDYKPGLYFYLVLPFVKFIGLNAWAVRIPGALFGVATVLLIYFLINKLFTQKNIGLIAAFFLAISPWHVHFSRGGWEVNVATAFIVLATLLFIKGTRDGKHLIFSAVAFAAALYTYHSARIIVPLLGIGLTAIYWQDLKTKLKYIFIAGIAGLLILMPLANDLRKSEISSRATGVGIFSDLGTLARINEQRGEHAYLNNIYGRLLHNKGVNYALAFFENWTEHFHGEFLFLTGDVIERNRVPETGQM